MPSSAVPPYSPDALAHAQSLSAPARRNHVLTIALEDYFHAAPFRPWIPEETWHRFEDRLVASTHRVLELLERCGAKATFFVTLAIAKRIPELIHRIVAGHHEIAGSGDITRGEARLTPEEFGLNAVRCREFLERTAHSRVQGYRLATHWLQTGDVWMLDQLARAGYRYDCSTRAALFSDPAAAWRARGAKNGSEPFSEISVSSINLLGVRVPLGGGGPFRHYPERLTKGALAYWDRYSAQPFVLYLRTWELDTEQPRITGVPLHARLRHYRNLQRMPRLLEEVLSSYQFTTVAQYLGLDSAPLPVTAVPNPLEVGRQASSATQAAQDWTPSPALGSAPPQSVTVVIPCYNETSSLPSLERALQQLVERFQGQYVFTFLFVDDRSTDETWATLGRLFGSRSDCVVLRHDRNRGAAAAIQTGIRHAPDEVVCSIDCDCTYDPQQLGVMIPLLTDGVDLVTASPYHPDGRVKNVAAWRLFLSRACSRAYRMVLHHKLHTYTSCFRVYRKQSAAPLELQLPGFLGIVELLARLDEAGGRIVECPATLEVRMLGFSKMKILRTIVGHVRFLANIGGRRLHAPERSTTAESGF